MHRVHVNSLDWSRRCPIHGHYSRLPCAWPGCANGIDVDSFIEVDGQLTSPDRETRYDRVEWPAFKDEVYYSWETSGWPSPWVNAKSVAANEHRRRRPPPALPDVIYQYTSAAALQGMVENDELWLTDYAYLNDASELVHGRKALESALTKLSESGAYSHSDQVFAPWLDKLRNSAPPRICVASFSMDGDSLSQWRAYGGLAIGFDGPPAFSPVLSRQSKG